METEKYLKLVKKLTPKPNKKKDYCYAFLMGGFIGMLGEIIKLLLMDFNVNTKDAISYTLLIIIFTSSLLTSLGFFDDLVSKFKAGIIIPITGFAHSVMASILDYKNDGYITGVGSNIFKLAGSVILYGVVSGYICGIIKVIINV